MAWFVYDAGRCSGSRRGTAICTRGRSKGIIEDDERGARNANRLPIRAAVDTCLINKGTKAKRTQQKYKLALNTFVDSVSIRFMDEITVDVLRGYQRKLTADGYNPKTVEDFISIPYCVLPGRVKPDMYRPSIPYGR